MSTAILRDFTTYVPTVAENARFKELLETVLEQAVDGTFHAADTRPTEMVNALRYALQLVEDNQPFLAHREGHRSRVMTSPPCAMFATRLPSIVREAQGLPTSLEDVASPEAIERARVQGDLLATTGIDIRESR